MARTLPAPLLNKMRELSTHNATAHRLLQLWEFAPLTYEEWSSQAIVVLLEQNEILFKTALDLRTNMPMPPMIVPS